MYLDHHTHISGMPSKAAEIMRIYSMDAVHIEDLKHIPNLRSLGHGFTIGLHPMSYHGMSFDLVSTIISEHREHILGIGECGLDTRLDIPRKEQIELFIKHAELAMDMHLPLIIHCVRSHDDIVLLHRTLKPSNPWIMHGFNRTEQIANSLLDQGILLSIGKELLDHRHPISSFFRKIAEYPFFLETDGKDIAIQSLYQRASELLDMSIEEISTLLIQHARQVYGTINFNGPTLE